METIDNSINSELYSINDLIESPFRFNIPRYQRLYVWQNEQIDTLLEDLYDAFTAKKDLFYLGGILIVRSDADNQVYDLIDGQQRFTTLWLLSLELGNSLFGFTNVDNNLRLKFAIREEVTNYFNGALNSIVNPEEATHEQKNNSLSRIINARKRITTFIQLHFKDAPEKKVEFAAFIRDCLKLIISEVPSDTDLNKLFEVINNRGIQLQHHEILKASLLSHFTNKQERIRYGKIWNACADMENYVERSMRQEVGKNLSNSYNRDSLTFDLDVILDLMKENREKTIELDLNAILEGKKVDMPEDKNLESDAFDHPDATDGELEPVRSILTFPQLLLHTLRIYLFQRGRADIHKISEKE